MKTSLLFIILTISIFAGNEQVQKQLNAVNKNFFIENKGQWPSEVKYLARAGGMNAWITNTGVVYDYFQITKDYDKPENLKKTPDKEQEFERQNTIIRGNVVNMQFVDANTSPVQLGNNKQEGYYNYFIGNDQNKWASNVPLFQDIALNDVCPGINVKYYFDGDAIRYDYTIKPWADISKLILKFEGQESIRINEQGELVIKTSLGEVLNGNLYSYQTYDGIKKEVPCRFEQNQNGTITFNAKSYDQSKELIIDPLVYSTYLGGSDLDEGISIVSDPEGNAYLTGCTRSTTFPTTSGAYQSTFNGYMDAFITKLNPTGTSLVYSSYIGGSDRDLGNAITSDAFGNIYITGWTLSSDFPLTPGAFQTNPGGGTDAFVMKLNPSGNVLIYSTLIGGKMDEVSSSIQVDTTGSVFIAGNTSSTDFPITLGAYQTVFGGINYGDCFVTKINPNGTALIYSTYIGGSNTDKCNSIKINSAGNAYITGYTSSSDYPTTSGVYQTTFGGRSNGFITELNSNGTGLVYSTFIGGLSADFAFSLAIDLDGNAYCTGWGTGDYPITSGAFHTTYSDGGVFVTKLNPSGSSLVYSALFGGIADEWSYSIAVDQERNAYITGYTNSFDYPTTPGAFQTTKPGPGLVSNIFITKLNPEGNKLVYSTFLGGDSYEFGSSIVNDAEGNVYLTGQTESSNFPISTGAFQSTMNGGENPFVTKLNIPITSIQKENPIPSDYILCQNYPNPFNPATTINYSIPIAGNAKLTIYNVIGSKVATIVNEYKNAGNYSVQFNGINLASGIYLYRLESGNYSATKKFILMK